MMISVLQQLARACRPSRRRETPGKKWRRAGWCERLEARVLLSATPYGATSQDTGEFMLGTVLVTPVFLESTGATDASTEDWTPALIEEAKERVQEGMRWWEETLANYSEVHSLNFIFDFQFADDPVPTRYEPISRVSNDYELWVNEFLDLVGHQTPETLHADIREFNHAQREAHGADWSFTVFVVNSANDLDGQFAPGGSFTRAFAFAGGRFFVSPSTRPSSTFAHETGHMFWARDEYIGGGSYLDSRGYYDTQNWNAVNNPTPGFVHQPSIMSSGSSLNFAYQMHVSADSALEMIGWRDSNGNGIFDVLDVPHHLEGTGYFDTTLGKYRFQGHAEAGTLPNMNSSGLQNDITINRITHVEYRVDGGDWLVAAEPGTFAAELDVKVAIPEGRHLVEIRTITRDPGTLRLVTSSPVFAGWSDQRAATVETGIQGFLWNDVDADGEWDPREIGLAGQTVQLVDQHGVPLPDSRLLDPDDYDNQAVLNQSQPGVSLRAAGINVSGQSVLSRPSSDASTGTRVFSFRDPLGNARETWFRDGSELHVRFDEPQSFVQLDAVGATSSSGSAGRLEAFNAAGDLLARYNTAPLAPGDVETMTIARPSSEITSLKAFGLSLQPILLDHLRWGPPGQVTTNRHGSYEFRGLPAGSYQVETVPAAGATIVVPADSSYEVALDTTSVAAGRNFAIHPRWPWQNPLDRYDVDGSGTVNPFDALVVVAEIQTSPGTKLPFPSAERAPPGYYDVSGDGQLNPFDAMLVVSHLLESSRIDTAGAAWTPMASPPNSMSLTGMIDVPEGEASRSHSGAERGRTAHTPRNGDRPAVFPTPTTCRAKPATATATIWTMKVDALVANDRFLEELDGSLERITELAGVF